MIVSYRFSQFLHYFMFSRSRNPFLTFLLSYHVRVTLENPGQLPVQEVLGGTGDCVL